jgi:anti-sigma B factor antagonist
MAVKPFGAAIRQEGGAVIVDLAGQIDSFAEERLNAVYQEAAAATSGGIVLNFSEVQYINSTGIALIVSLLAQARKARRELAVFGLSDHYRQIFEITRLADFMSIYPDETSALTEASRE